MSVITYIALRDLEPTIVVTQDDISVSAVDDSFNAPAGLLGFLDNEWILVSGFSDPINNGWFQLNGNSTAAKILQDSTTPLVTEAAGNDITIQGYKRGLNETYSMEAGLSVADRSVKVVKNSKQPLGGGSPETLLHRREVFLDVRTTSLEEVVMGQWREFLASVEGGEPFTFDRYGSLVSPVEPKTVELVSDSYAEAREFMFRYRISFRVRVLS
jgi:hypothetical protein